MIFVSAHTFPKICFLFSPGSSPVTINSAEMALVESAAAFRARGLMMGIDLASLEALQAAPNNVDTFAAFAFLVPYNAAAPDDRPLTEALTGILPVAPSVTTMGKFRRLQFESYTMILADARSRVERTEESAPRKMPAPERHARLQEQITRLSGVDISQGNEPSHALIDTIHQMLEDGMIKHLPVQKSTCRSQELQGVKSDSEVASLGSDFLVRQAFLRRALAFDQAQIISFKTHETWANSLFESMQRDPPPGYARTSLSQILAADKEIFVLMGEQCRAGIAQTATGVRPANDCMLRLMDHSKIQFLLLPLPTPGGRGGNPTKRNWDQSTSSDLGLEIAANSKGKGKGGAKGKSKGKNKAGKSQSKAPKSLPTALAGCVSVVNGKRPCFSFNIDGCDLAGPGDSCFKGIHLCCRPNCGEAHAAKNCPKR